MPATSGELPVAAEDDRWGYEMKWDGVRAAAYLDGDRLPRLISRNDRDIAVSYPELAALATAVGGTPVIVDGEIVAFDAAGRPAGPASAGSRSGCTSVTPLGP